MEEICKKSIFVVNFESGATRGGEAELGQILNFALQNPVVDGVTYRKGGVGAFRVDLEYAVNTPDVVNGDRHEACQGPLLSLVASCYPAYEPPDQVDESNEDQ